MFVDNVADHIRDLRSLAKNIGPDGRQLTIIGTERTNEWNVSCASLSSLVTRSYELRYLAEPEIDRLLALLAKHRALGTLENASSEERRKAFVEHAGRQLLVALHEATRGIPFEDIIVDEFNTIIPQEAQQLYLTVCVLNRLNVPVRAGLIARIHGIHFEHFRERLFQPLEHVVNTRYDPILRDYLYYARHPQIAEIVFDRILTNSEQRFNAYLNCLTHMNIDYDVDRKAFRQMIRGRSLLEVLCSHELIKQIYSVAKDCAGNDAYLLHQMALYEMHRPNGNLRQCGELLKEAQGCTPHDRSIKHSMAEYYLKCAEGARSDLEAERCFDQAAGLCSDLKRRATEDSYAHHTLAKIELLRLKRALESDEGSESDLENMLKRIEQNLADGLQKFPGDSHLLGAEASLATFLADSDRALRALEKAFSANPRNAYIASRLARCYDRTGSRDKAEDTLKKAIEAKRDDKSLHFAYARLLMESPRQSSDNVLYHLKRAFAPGDTNYHAQLLYGRQLFIAGEDESRKIFHELAKARVSSELRDELLYELGDVYHGQIVRLEATYCFIERDGRNDWIFAHRYNIDENIWNVLIRGKRVKFHIAFSFRGPGAYDVAVDSSEFEE